MTMLPYRSPTLYGMATLLLCAGASCTGEDSGPPLVVQRDSAGIQIVEAMRPLWGDSSLWSIDPDPVVDLTLTGSGPEHDFFRSGSMKQRPDGSLVIADRDSREVRVFSENGEFQGAFGGRGDGPGEFTSLGRVENAGDTLLAIGRGRVVVASHDLAVIRTFNIDRYAYDLHYLRGGTVLPELRPPVLPQEGVSGLIRSPQALVLFDLEGTQIDSIGETRGSESYVHARDDEYGGAEPLFARSAHIETLEGLIFRGSSDMMQVEELDTSGRLVRFLRVPGYPLDLSDVQVAAEREARLEAVPAAMPAFLRRMVEDLPSPATRPAYDDILVDPSGALWLELHRGASEQDQPQEWLVLDADGIWLGTVKVPDDFRVTDVTMETVLGVWRDELDVEHPQVLRLTQEGG